MISHLKYLNPKKCLFVLSQHYTIEKQLIFYVPIYTFVTFYLFNLEINLRRQRSLEEMYDIILTFIKVLYRGYLY